MAQTPDQLPPYDTEAELGCIGCILQASEESAHQWLSDLSIEHFYDVRNQEVYRALICLKGQGTNVISLIQWLKDKNRLSQAGGMDYVANLPECSPSPALWPSFFTPLENCRVRRTALSDFAELSLIARNKAIDLPVLADAAKRMAIAYSENGNSKSLTLRDPVSLLAMEFDDTDRILGDRLLAKGQPMVIAGAGSLGKSRMAFQMATCIITSQQFIGFETRGEELRWLFLQAENSNRRLQQDMLNLKKWLSPDQWAKVCRQLIIHTLETDADNFLSLDSDKTQERISNTINLAKPDIIVWDSLYNFGIGNLNTDEDMAASLLTIAQLTKAGHPHRCPVILHHAVTGKAGAAKATGYDRASFSRNSKVIHQWTRGQINVAPGSPDDPSILVVSCGKCSNGQEFQPFAIHLNPDSMIYEVEESFDLEAWQADVSGKKAAIPTKEVASFCFPPVSRKDLSAKIIEEFGCTRESSYKVIRRSVKNRSISFNKESELFVRS